MEIKEREPGFYWVKEKDSQFWTIANYSAQADRWVKCGDDGWLFDDDLIIDERRIQREPTKHVI